MKAKEILSSKRYDFFMFLAFLQGNNISVAKKVMNDQLCKNDIPILMDLEDNVNRNLEQDMLLYKGRNFQIYLSYLMMSEQDEKKVDNLIELQEEFSRILKINKLGIYSPRIN